VSRTPSGVAYGLVRAPGAAPVIVPSTASEPMFDTDVRAWQADASAAGFFVTLPGGRP